MSPRISAVGFRMCCGYRREGTASYAATLQLCKHFAYFWRGRPNFLFPNFKKSVVNAPHKKTRGILRFLIWGKGRLLFPVFHMFYYLFFLIY